MPIRWSTLFWKLWEFPLPKPKHPYELHYTLLLGDDFVEHMFESNDQVKERAVAVALSGRALAKSIRGYAHGGLIIGGPA